VARGSAHDDGNVELVNELLEVEGLLVLGDVLGTHRRATNDEQVDARLGDGLVQLLSTLRRERTGDGDARGTDLSETARNEFGLDGLGVDLLHALRGLGGRKPANLGEKRLGVVVAGPE